MWLTLLAGPAAAASPAAASPPAFLVRIDDREGRRVVAPNVTVVYSDGSTYTLAMVDDGATLGDAAAGDALWIARFDAPVAGDTRVLVTDGPPDRAAQAFLDKTVKLRADRVNRVQLEVTGAVTSSVSTEVVSAESEAARAFPVTEAAKTQGEPMPVGRWQPGHLSALAALLMLGLVAWDTVRQRVARVDEAVGGLLPGRRAPPDALSVERARKTWTAAVVAGLAALWIAVWGAGALTLRHRFLGIEHVDHYGTQWFYWFVEWALRNLANPAVSDRFFYPWGKDLYAHTGANILDAYVALPLRLLFGHVVGYNLFIGAGAIANGLTFYSLARDYTEDRLAAAVSSVLFALFPYMLIEFQEGRPTQAIVVLPVLFIKHALRTCSGTGLRDPVFAGLLLAATGYQYWFYAIFGGLVVFAHGVWRTTFPMQGSGGRLRTLFRHGVMCCVALVLVLPVALPLALRSSSGEVEGLLDTDRWSLWSSPPVTIEGQYIAIFAWQPLRRYGGFFLQDSDDMEERYIEEKLTTPWLLIPLALLYLFRPHRFPRGSFVAMMFAAVVIASGPVFLVGDYALPNAPYIYLVKSIGVFKRLWWPQRMALFLAIPSMLALAAVLSWIGRTAGARAQGLVSLGVLAAWAGDLHDGTVLPFPTWNARVPAGYQCLGLAKDKEGGIIELPFAWTQAHVYYQTVHEHPMLGGMLEDNVSFTPPSFTEFRQNNTFVKGLYDAADADSPTLSFTEEDSTATKDLGYRYVVLQKDAWNEVTANSEGSEVETLAALLGLLDQHLGPRVYDDARIALYAPWGDPPPCDPADVQPDLAPVGKMEATPNSREPDINLQLFTRL